MEDTRESVKAKHKMKTTLKISINLILMQITDWDKWYAMSKIANTPVNKIVQRSN